MAFVFSDQQHQHSLRPFDISLFEAPRSFSVFFGSSACFSFGFLALAALSLQLFYSSRLVNAIATSSSPGLRQAPGAAPIGDAPIQNPAPVVATVTVQAPAVEPVPAKPAPVKPAVPEPPAAPPPVSNVPFVTVQWAETFIGGTYSTWWPHTVSLDFKPAEPQAPLPGKGAIGMGTLTGKTGVTKTVAMGAAPTQGSGWMRGVVAAVGVGIAGVVV
ncbi:hypothetical protein BDW02DRAFT_645155 [Decorospora gaudefroyi]|uniref:Uncharacterized protein n=1 Tax=Decorospora gaudefroyi TaxID=184978 RepID=A0A6A5KVY0_9PLEO|nr:hypothetical protein BDW02DRAFT_645155 [Decorospora gaudefroyi]